MKYRLILFIGAHLTLFPGCGKKQRTIFDFQTTQIQKINHLALPAIRNVMVQKKSMGNLISWNALSHDTVSATLPDHKPHLVGYHVYRLSRPGCVEKKPLTRKPIQQCSYLDRSPVHPHAYLVRGVFSCNKKIVVGTASKIAHADKK